MQHSRGSSRLRGMLCPWKPGQAWRKAGAELPKPHRAMLELQEAGHRLSSSILQLESFCCCAGERMELRQLFPSFSIILQQHFVWPLH